MIQAILNFTYSYYKKRFFCINVSIVTLEVSLEDTIWIHFLHSLSGDTYSDNSTRYFTYNARIECTNMLVPLQSPDNLYVRHSANIGRRGHQKYFFGSLGHILDTMYIRSNSIVCNINSVSYNPINTTV